MRLETMTPDPDWDPEGHSAELSVVEALGDRLVIRVWCGDWCGDCRSLLPPFGAALESIGLLSAVQVYPVEKQPDGSKVGDRVDAFQVERIPTVVVEIDGEEAARFEEGRTDRPILDAIAAQLEGSKPDVDQA